MVEVWLSLERKITRRSLGKITVIGENDCLAKMTEKQEQTVRNSAALTPLLFGDFPCCPRDEGHVCLFDVQILDNKLIAQ